MWRSDFLRICWSWERSTSCHMEFWWSWRNNNPAIGTAAHPTGIWKTPIEDMSPFCFGVVSFIDPPCLKNKGSPNPKSNLDDRRSETQRSQVPADRNNIHIYIYNIYIYHFPKNYSHPYGPTVHGYGSKNPVLDLISQGMGIHNYILAIHFHHIKPYQTILNHIKPY